MRITDGFIAVDWGTTNRRLYVVEPDGSIGHRVADACGVTAVDQGGFAAEVARIRARYGDRPLLLAGMIGSNRGWIETPYLPCPCDLAALARAVVPADTPDTIIVPGVSYRNGGRCDVMRGEEMQLIGAVAARLAPADGLACHPGTHAKWALLESGAITAFRSVMTGELFALLKTHSILAAQLDRPVTPGAAFGEGVARALERSELSADLFSVRARGLLGDLAPEDAASFTSGLLIGADVRIGMAMAPEQAVSVIGDPGLTRLYAAALEQAGTACTEIDGEDAFLGGVRALAEALR